MGISIQLLANKKINLDLVGFSKAKTVSIQLPDLSKIVPREWGNWGPMYFFELTPENAIQLGYDGKMSSLDQSNIRIESPIFATERKVYPLYCVVHDTQYDLSFKIFFDAAAQVAKVKVNNSEVRALVSQEASATESEALAI